MITGNHRKETQNILSWKRSTHRDQPKSSFWACAGQPQESNHHASENIQMLGAVSTSVGSLFHCPTAFSMKNLFYTEPEPPWHNFMSFPQIPLTIGYLVTISWMMQKVMCGKEYYCLAIYICLVSFLFCQYNKDINYSEKIFLVLFLIECIIETGDASPIYGFNWYFVLFLNPSSQVSVPYNFWDTICFIQGSEVSNA